MKLKKSDKSTLFCLTQRHNKKKEDESTDYGLPRSGRSLKPYLPSVIIRVLRGQVLTIFPVDAFFQKMAY